MKRSIRFFAIGLLTSSVLLFGYYFFFDKADELESIPADKLISKIETDGYRVITEEEFITYSLMKESADEEEASNEPTDKDNNKQTEDKKSNDKKDSTNKKDEDEEKDKDKVKKITFTTKEGVVSQDIADILIENKVIDDRQKFLDYLDDNDYSGYIQVGKFEVTTDMTYKELAKVVTTYPGN